MWPILSHILSPLTNTASGSKGRNILWNDSLEDSFTKLKCMISAEKSLIYSYWTIPFTVHTNTSDKKLGAVIVHNNKPIQLFPRRINKLQRTYTTTEKEFLVIFEYLRQIRGIILGYEINVFSDHKTLVYAVTLSESQIVMRWQPII